MKAPFLRALLAFAKVCPGLVLGLASTLAQKPEFSGVDRPTIVLDAAMVRAEVRGAPEVKHVGRVAPDALLLVVQAQSIEHGLQVRYEAQAGDEIELRKQHRVLKRDGVVIGSLVGVRQDVLHTVDELVGEALDLEWAMEPASYEIRVEGEAEARSPVSVYRASRPHDAVRSPGGGGHAAIHHLYLRFEESLEEGAAYRLSIAQGKLSSSEISFSCDWQADRSEAVHVSQIGFRPDDPVKLAYLSTWMGDGGGIDYGEGLRFAVVDELSGAVVYEGKSELSQPESAPGNVSGTDVYRLDFSSVVEPGDYRIAVEGVGSSFPFEIGEGVWANAFGSTLNALHCQRNGIELGPPLTPFLRFRSFMPEDGFKVYASDTKPGVHGQGMNRFESLLAGRTERVLPDAWGGWMDAGDWDRRPDHALMPLAMFDLLEMFPKALGEINSESNFPDLAEEALWGVDFLQRMQEEDGSVRGGIESGAHPRSGETSWQESLLVMAFAPTVESTLDFTAIAARASRWLQGKDDNRADAYLEDALRAMSWVEGQSRDLQEKAVNHLALAAAELYRLTGDEKWHQLFLSSTRFKSEGAAFSTHAMGAVKDPQGAAAWTYLMTDAFKTDRAITSRIKAALVREADATVENVFATDFNFAGGPERTIIWGALSVPEANVLVRAHFVTEREKYLESIVLSAQSGAGANPLNMCYTTGIGQRWPQNPLHEDARRTRQPLYAGVTIGGPIQTGLNRQPAAPGVESQLYPSAADWPASESYFDVYSYPAMCEFTVHQTMLPTAFVWGYLAGRP